MGNLAETLFLAFIPCTKSDNKIIVPEQLNDDFMFRCKIKQF